LRRNAARTRDEGRHARSAAPAAPENQADAEHYADGDALQVKPRVPQFHRGRAFLSRTTGRTQRVGLDQPWGDRAGAPWRFAATAGGLVPVRGFEPRFDG